LINPGGDGINLIIESEVTDLPLPDSPTIPIVLPLGISKDTFLTASNSFPSLMNTVCSSLMLKTLLLLESGKIKDLILVYCKYVKKYVSRKEELEIAKSKKKKIISQRVQDSQTRYVLEYKASISFDYILTSLQ
jgi:hypothetical protein